MVLAVCAVTVGIPPAHGETTRCALGATRLLPVADQEIRVLRQQRTSLSDYSVELFVEHPAPVRLLGGEAQSSVTTLSVNCPSRKTRFDHTRFYRESCLAGEFARKDGSGLWSVARPGTVEFQVVTALCEADLKTDAAAISDAAGVAKSFAGAPAPPEPAGADLFQVQLLSSLRRASAEAAVDAAARRYASQAAGATFQVEATSVKGRPMFRAVISPFFDGAPADAVCALIRRDGGDCFVRRRSHRDPMR